MTDIKTIAADSLSDIPYGQHVLTCLYCGHDNGMTREDYEAYPHKAGDAVRAYIRHGIGAEASDNPWGKEEGDVLRVAEAVDAEVGLLRDQLAAARDALTMQGQPSDDDLRVEAGNAFLSDEDVGITDEAASLDPTHAETYGAGYIKGYRAALATAQRHGEGQS